jgi:hypothetical protein
MVHDTHVGNLGRAWRIPSGHLFTLKTLSLKAGRKPGGWDLTVYRTPFSGSTPPARSVQLLGISAKKG